MCEVIGVILIGGCDNLQILWNKCEDTLKYGDDLLEQEYAIKRVT